MTRICLSISVVLLFAACGKPKPAPEEDPAPAASGTTATAAPSADVVAKAKTTFEQRCTPCHGASGNGDGPASASLSPKPRNYTVKVHRKARRKAMRSALSVHAERGSVAVVKASDFDTPSTKAASEALTKWGAKRSTLVIILGEETGLLRSFRNIPRIDVMEVGAIGVVDVIGAASIVISEGALEVLEKRAGTDSQGAEPNDTTTEKGGE